MRIAFLGLGSMGLPMASNLARTEHDVTVWNRTRSKAESVEGAVVADSPAEAAKEAELVITMVSDDAAVEAIVFGDNGVLEAMAPGACHACMSTISVDLSRKLEASHRSKGQRFVAAPVFGRPDIAQAAALRVVAGGQPEAVEACRPAFEVLGQGIIEAGSEPANANVMKLAGNFLLASAIEAMAEAYTMVGAHGVSTRLFHETMAQGLFRSPIYEGYGGMIEAQRYEPAGFALQHGLKDVRLALQAAEEVTVPMPFGSILRDRLMSAVARGWGSSDWSALGRVASADAGVRKADGR